MGPFLLTPAYKDYLWGGTKLKTLYGKQSDFDIVAESWELSAHADGDGTIATGPLTGTSFAAFVKQYPQLCGTHNQHEAAFPVLIKFIDAKGSLSIQVHPDDAYAQRVEGEPGKTEMWVVLENEPGAFLYHGFNRPVSKAEFAARIGDGTLPEVLHKVEVKPGDVIFIEAGTIHAIGAGIVLAEVQQNSNSTYRVFDFGRVGADGKPRELHIEKALDVTRLEVAGSAAPGAGKPETVAGGIRTRLAACPKFTVDAVELDGCYRQALDGSSFVSVLCTDGEGRLATDEGELDFRKGDSLFVPADQPYFTLEGKAKVLLSTV